MAIHLLIADDHAMVREGLRLILDAEIDIETIGGAADGRQALREVKRLRPDVAIMDIAMPGLNGIEATRRLRKAFPDTEVIILSMHANPEYIHQALAAGAQGYVLKESAGKEVVAAVRAVHDGRRFLSEKIAETVIDDYIQQRRPRSDDSPWESLSPREREILQLVAEGQSSAQIAKRIYLSPKTVETYRSRLMHKLGISNLPSLVRLAIKHHLIPVE